MSAPDGLPFVPDVRDVTADRVVADIEREVGTLTLYQAIAVRRIVDQLIDARWTDGRCPECPWG